MLVVLIFPRFCFICNLNHAASIFPMYYSEVMSILNFLRVEDESDKFSKRKQLQVSV